MKNPDDRNPGIVRELLKMGKNTEALELFNKINPSETTDYWLLKGSLDFRFQHWGEAINAYHHVLDIEPENEEATNHLHMIHDIISFWNPDQFNP